MLSQYECYEYITAVDSHTKLMQGLPLGVHLGLCCKQFSEPQYGAWLITKLLSAWQRVRRTTHCTLYRSLRNELPYTMHSILVFLVCFVEYFW